MVAIGPQGKAGFYESTIDFSCLNCIVTGLVGCQQAHFPNGITSIPSLQSIYPTARLTIVFQAEGFGVFKLNIACTNSGSFRDFSQSSSKSLYIWPCLVFINHLISYTFLLSFSTSLRQNEFARFDMLASVLCLHFALMLLCFMCCEIQILGVLRMFVHSGKDPKHQILVIIFKVDKIIKYL